MELASEEKASMEEARWLIDQDIEGHLTAVVASRSQRNLLAPISRLPPELMADIFLRAKAADLEKGRAYASRDWRWWVSLSHVCSHWRYVALNCPTFWDDPPLGNRRWVAAMLERSKAAKLTVNADFDSYLSVRDLKQVFRHSARIKHLSFMNVHSTHQEVLNTVPTCPRLESLRIYGLPYLATRRASRDKRYVPDNALANAESLRRLEISSCGILRIDWNSHSFLHITHLKLCHIQHTSNAALLQFMDALSKMTELRLLELREAFDVPDTDATSTLEEIFSATTMRFPHLKYLVLGLEPASMNAMFLTNAYFPPSASVRIWSDEPADRDFPDVFASIARIYTDGTYTRNVSALTPFRALAVNQEGCTASRDHCIRFILFTDIFNENDAWRSYSARSTVPLTLGFGNYDDTFSTSMALSDFFTCRFPLENITHVHLDVENLQPITVAHTAGTLPALSFVKAVGPAVKPFLNALHPNSDIRPADLPGFYFAKLASVHIEDIVVSKNSILKSHKIPLKVLQDVFAQRLQCGAPIRSLTLRDCERLGEEDVVGLREILELEWDGPADQSDPGWREDSDVWLSYGSGDSSDEDGEESDTDDDDDKEYYRITAIKELGY